MPDAAPGSGSEHVPTYVIIGNGIAGVTAAEILRTEDAAAHITVIADDPFPVYYRPALKDYLAGRVGEDNQLLPGRARALPAGAGGGHPARAAHAPVAERAADRLWQAAAGERGAGQPPALSRGATRGRNDAAHSCRLPGRAEPVERGTARGGERERDAGAGKRRDAAPPGLRGDAPAAPPHCLVGSAGCRSL